MALGAMLAAAGAACAGEAPSPWAAAPWASPEARAAAQRAFEGGDARGRPFAILDKRQARLLVFAADGRLAGAAAALIGLARGDVAVPGLGRRAPHEIAPHERTTPAGRFDSTPGFNHRGEAIVWFDYDAALAIHRLRPAPPHERRPQRLASASAVDKRISLGCIVVDGGFFDRVVAPILGQRRGVVYVLPEEAAARVGP
ncbi:MAG: L,D-transpeptidase [Rubrivivax sp.]|nr:L,D-transpeptidase [Rubrivivax sp.]